MSMLLVVVSHERFVWQYSGIILLYPQQAPRVNALAAVQLNNQRSVALYLAVPK